MADPVLMPQLQCSQHIICEVMYHAFENGIASKISGGKLPFDIAAHPAVRHTVARRLLDRMEADAWLAIQCEGGVGVCC